jgi:glycosyltransferase involved in cell wall biosynthesis
VDTVLLSVILAIRNEGPFIEHALTELLNQDIDYRKVEILVADGCSDDQHATEGCRYLLEIS